MIGEDYQWEMMENIHLPLEKGIKLLEARDNLEDTVQKNLIALEALKKYKEAGKHYEALKETRRRDIFLIKDGGMIRDLLNFERLEPKLDKTLIVKKVDLSLARLIYVKWEIAKEKVLIAEEREADRIDGDLLTMSKSKMVKTLSKLNRRTGRITKTKAS